MRNLLSRLAFSSAVLLAGCGNTISPQVVDGDAEQAVQSGIARLHNPQRAIFWAGEVGPEDAPTGGEPPECAEVPCEHIQVEVDLPPSTFSNPNRPGGIQVALRWFGDPGAFTLPSGVPGCCGEVNTLHVFIYKDGQMVGLSAGIIAVAQSAFIPSPANGIYDIYVAYEPTYNLDPSVPYEGLVQVEHAPQVLPVRPLLPDIEFRGTERITFQTPSFPIFEADPAPGETCFQSEKDEDGAQTCLRFDQIIANDGQGPLEMWFDVADASGEVAGITHEVRQRVFNSDGSTTDRATGGNVELHGVHGHYHYSSFASSELWASDASGRRLGDAPIRHARKVSFCVADIKLDRWGQKGDGPRTYMAPDCLFPAYSDETGDHYKQGLTNGWSDVYDWYINDQYIEVSGVADGYYLLRFCADPDNTLLESDESNNCLSNLIHLSNVDSANRQVTLLDTVRNKRGGRNDR